mmetsp:Transcript_5018/g.15286  ORF Transcript_5018/g.15286 Transcript_5018/m.15286 type:complete len:244 (+) Transcript_5018:516-1247(+)
MQLWMDAPLSWAFLIFGIYSPLPFSRIAKPSTPIVRQQRILPRRSPLVQLQSRSWCILAPYQGEHLVVPALLPVFAMPLSSLNRLHISPAAIQSPRAAPTLPCWMCAHSWHRAIGGCFLSNRMRRGPGRCYRSLGWQGASCRRGVAFLRFAPLLNVSRSPTLYPNSERQSLATFACRPSTHSRRWYAMAFLVSLWWTKTVVCRLLSRQRTFAASFVLEMWNPSPCRHSIISAIMTGLPWTLRC